MWLWEIVGFVGLVKRILRLGLGDGSKWKGEDKIGVEGS